MKNNLLFVALLFSFSAVSQDSNSPLVSFDDYEQLVKTVKEHRKSRLVDLTTFNEMSLRQDVYILDTRSKRMYDRKHVKGAIHLNFSDFTQENLDALFPNRNATILIYCNNNFMDDSNLADIVSDVNFASKVSAPQIDYSELESAIEEYQTSERSTQNVGRQNINEISAVENTIAVPESAITLALNIPTYINLYGYGYRNVYELSELISVFDPRIEFEGTEVVPIKD